MTLNLCHLYRWPKCFSMIGNKNVFFGLVNDIVRSLWKWNLYQGSHHFLDIEDVEGGS